ncbi:unnamed protein product [Brassicogethes aeneus]|uniref:BED-type domain-containing protein n=1 Tax=Brassicogethes aeneus TaxID=1431903 RepID=A0A9P0FPZ5_BRAAE|nr:unnamed protein product [Brassicogethes aeneus]
MASMNTNSFVWKHFYKEEANSGIATCFKRRKTYRTSGNTSNLRDHLKRAHNITNQSQIRKRHTDDRNAFETQTTDTYLQPRKMRSQTLEESKSRWEIAKCKCGFLTNFNNTTNLKDHSQRNHQKKWDKATGNNSSGSQSSNEENVSTITDGKSERKKALDNAVAKFVIKDLQPLSVVEDEGFKNLIFELDPRYSLPCRRTLRDKLITEAYEKILEVLSGVLARTSQISLTFDGWSSRTMQHYLTVTGHFLEDMVLKVATLGVISVPGRSTVADLKLLLNTLLTDKFPNLKISCAVTDNAKNMSATCKHMKLPHLPCIAHSIQLVINAAILQTNEKKGSIDVEETDLFRIIDDDDFIETCVDTSVYSILKKCKQIVTFFHRSGIAIKELSNELIIRDQKDVKLIQSVETRWNSSYYMLKSVYAAKDAIAVVLSNVDNGLQPLTSQEAKLIPEILEILKPFVDMTEELGGDTYVTISRIIPSIKEAIINGKSLTQTLSSKITLDFQKKNL